jgi:lipoyl(octanoyl) transferase
MKFTDWGLFDYKEAWDRQRIVVDKVIAAKNDPDCDKQQIIFCEHPHVYTLGRNGKPQNLLVSDSFLTGIKIPCYRTDRGGDITYHGPGQIVCYPILDLERLHCGLKEYIFILEEAVIKTLRHYHIDAERLTGATGVWLDANKPSARKICAIGVHASHFVTMHGFALNVNTDLDYYRHINPCGFTDKGITSIQHETGKPANMAEIKTWLYRYLHTLISLKINK